MNDSAHRTLFHPFETGDIAPPASSARALFLGAVPDFRLPEGFAAELAAVQGYRPHFLGLQRRGLAVTPTIEDSGYDLSLVLLGRHKGENLQRLADALHATRAGGLVLVAGGKAGGVDSFRRKVAKALPLAGSLSKYHGVAFWLQRPDDAGLAVSGLADPPAPSLVDGRFATAPGMFSHDRIDAGSRLLVENLPKLKGHVADFGAGWGYLSAELLRRGDELAALDLYEADFASLEAAKQNLSALAGELPLSVHWQDLRSEPVPRRYDAVVMNPPFHEGRAAEPAIGADFVRAASQALKPGGRLHLVANRGLPYEKVLEAGFAASGETCRDARFKVLWARR